MTTTATETAATRDPEDMFRDAIELMRDAYGSHVEACADGVEERVREGGDGFDLTQILHEEIDGDSWVIWTNKAKAVCLVSSNSGYSVSEYGAEGVVKGGEIDWSAMAFGALSQDVTEELDLARGRHLDAGTVAGFFGEDADADPECDHADGCERMARWRGLDAKGKPIATFCATHRLSRIRMASSYGRCCDGSYVEPVGGSGGNACRIALGRARDREGGLRSGLCRHAT